MKTLVTYYSHSGHTAALAHQIAMRLGADEEAILERDKRNGMLGLVAGGLGAALGASSGIAKTEHDPADYDLVVLGTPVWTSRAAPAVNAYIDAHRDSMARVAFFCTEGGRGDARAFSRMASRLGRAPVACLAITEDALSSPDTKVRLDRFQTEVSRAIDENRT